MPDGEVRNEIRRLRFERGELTQAQLAEEVGCSRQTIVLLEQGRYTPSLALAFRVARAFGRTVDEVFELAE